MLFSLLRALWQCPLLVCLLGLQGLCCPLSLRPWASLVELRFHGVRLEIFKPKVSCRYCFALYTPRIFSGSFCRSYERFKTVHIRLELLEHVLVAYRKGYSTFRNQLCSYCVSADRHAAQCCHLEPRTLLGGDLQGRLDIPIIYIVTLAIPMTDEPIQLTLQVDM